LRVYEIDGSYSTLILYKMIMRYEYSNSPFFTIVTSE
jgi:hypothetical protein